MDQHRRMRVGALTQLGGTQLVTLEDAAERGVRVVEFRTTTGLELGVVVDRAMDLAWCRFKGRSLAWHSPTGFVGPWYREVSGLGYLRSFGGGLLATSGLDHVLFPAEDPNDTYNYPGRESTTYGLHGRIGATPARLLEHGLEDGPDGPVLCARGEARQAGALAENLTLLREVRVPLDGATIQWRDTVTNDGWYPTPHMLLYHMNFGWPLVGEDSELVAPVDEVTFATKSVPADQPDLYKELVAPKPGFVEQAFVHRMAADVDGRVRVSLVNNSDPAAPWGMQLTYEQSAFPYFLQWRYFDAGTYLVGLEPSTNGIGGREAARESGELRMLEPGESRTYSTSVTVFEGAEAAATARAGNGLR